jgi:dTDP-4-dehydrorhamnose reductase
LRILVTGAGGQVGAELVRAAQRAGLEVVGLDRAALDVADAAAVARAFSVHRPSLVLHPAALTNVDVAEDDPAAAMRANRDGTRLVAQACSRADARLVAFSTDYVFDGEAGRPYLEDDAPAPLQAYGRSKLAGERAALAAHGDGTWIVRTAWVLSPAARTFLPWLLRVARDREAVDVVADQFSSPTWCPSLAEATLELVDRCPPGIYHLAGSGGPVSRLDLARAAVEAAGLELEIRPTTAAAFGARARRPVSTALETLHADAPRLPHWHGTVAMLVAALTD